MRRSKLFMRGLTVLAVLTLPAQSLPLRICVIRGISMVPSLYPGEVCWMDGVCVRKREIHRGEIVIFRQDSELVVKRVIGVPGDVIRERLGAGSGAGVACCRLHSNTYRTWKQQLTRRKTFLIVRLGIGEYYVLGDNLPHSFDSRFHGSVHANNIVGVLRPLQVSAMTEAVGDWLRRSPAENEEPIATPPDRKSRQGPDAAA